MPLPGSFMFGNTNFTGQDPAQGLQQQAWQGGQNQANRDLQQRLAGMQQGGENYRSQLAYNANVLPQELKQQRFGQIMPLLQGGLGNFTSAASSGGVGEASGQPTISAAPVWGEQQIQGQVNAQRAANDSATAGRIKTMQGSVAGRGFGANSPLAQALAGQYQGQNLATNTQNEQQTRFNTAQGNAQQLLSGQQAQEAQYANRQQEALRRQQTLLGTYGSLVGALAGLAN